jgi:phosphate acetyltransferase
VSFVDDIRARAAATPRRIALPESDDPRTLDAAHTLADAGVAVPVLIGPVSQAVKCEVIDPSRNGLADEVAAELLALRGPKGMTDA